MTADAPCPSELLTVRDWLRYGVSRFRQADLVFGHGTQSAVDEAAFLILHALHLPIDELDPWLDARLTSDEGRTVAELLHRRVVTRKPAAYLTGEAWMHGIPFTVDERVIVPRSFIGELLRDRLSPIGNETGDIQAVLDLCTGSGCLAILAALAFPEAHIDATELSGPALAVAEINVARHRLENRISLFEGDLFAPIAGKRYDLILANPPYVTPETVASFPPEYRHEPRLAHQGGADGLKLVRRVIAEAGVHLHGHGILVVETGPAQAILEAEYPMLPFVWPETAAGTGEVFVLSAADLRAVATADLNLPRHALSGRDRARPSWTAT